MASFRPDWLQEYLDGTLTMQNEYHGVSFAAFEGKTPDYDTMRLAKDRALDELCYQLSVSIKSRFEDNMAKKGDYEEQHIVSSLFVSTRKVISGVQEKEKYTDPKDQSYWVLLAVDKKAADRQLAQQAFINEVADRLEHKQEEILEGIKQITSILANHMQVYTERMNRLERLLQTIDTKVGSTNEQTKEEYASIRQEIVQMNAGRKGYEESLALSQRQQGEQIKELMIQNNELKNMLSRISGRIEKDYFLALANDDLEYKAIHPDFRITITPDKGQGADYVKGEKVRFLIQASRGCYIKVIYISSVDKDSGQEKKTNVLLFPNEFDRNNWINAGETKVIGSQGEIEVQEPFGKDIVTVVASASQFTDLETILTRTRGGYYSEDTSNTRGTLTLRTRGLAVVQPKTGASVTPAGKPVQTVPMATDTCFIVSHP
ncbi:MAG: DUF4384 domain-containing protein [Deltaproteobacteria bacterium]|nr:DUF4384 domain-containing protein [Deltaproteobacteria bacterium]